MLESIRLDGAELLIVSPTSTWPLDHGNRKRIFSVCNMLKARGAIIHFLFYPSESNWHRHYPKNAEKVMQEQWDYFYKVTPSIPLYMNAKGNGHLIDEWWDMSIENEVKWLIERNHFDAMIVNYSWLSKALTFAPKGCLRVLDTHDRFSGRGELLEANGIEKEFFYTSQNEEFKALERADLVWAIKHKEEVFFRKLLERYKHKESVKLETSLIVPEEEKDNYDYKNTEVKTLLHVEDKEGFEFHAPFKKNAYLTVGIVGAYNNINLVNTRVFLEMALPIFEKYMVPIKILLAGSMCKGLQDIDHPFVEQLGRVESLDDFYAQLDIALVPMTFSTGLKIKVGEALAYGVPLIAHAHAYEGYPVYHAWQTMESLEAVVEAAVEVAYDYRIIGNLQEASVTSHQALHSEVTKTLDHFISKLKEKCRTALMILPELDVGDYSLLKHNIEDIIKTLKEEYRIIFYYPYEVTTESRVYLEEKSNDGIVTCYSIVEKSQQLWSGVTIESIFKSWSFELLWNLSDKRVEKRHFNSNFYYFQDCCFRSAGMDHIDKNCDVLIQSVMTNSVKDNKFLDWYECPVSGIFEYIYQELWKNVPADESKAIYMMLSGTKEQIFFWHKVYSLMFEESYNLYWIIDSEEVDWYVKNRLDPVEISKNYMEFGDAPRCGIMVNFAKSNLLSTIAWTLFVCKRRIYDTEEVGMEKGQLKLSLLYREMKRSVEKLDLNNYNNRFQHTAYYRLNFEQILFKLKQQKVSLCLK